MGDASSDCIFCRIVSKQVSAVIVLEGPDFVAFMDSQPINPGHVLLVPRKHEPDFYKLDAENWRSIQSEAQRIACALQRLFNPKKVGMLVAGFDVAHTHVHVVPLHDYHDIGSRRIYSNSWKEASRAELLEASALLSDALKT
jgi:histidine triad (HIT) family protein